MYRIKFNDNIKDTTYDDAYYSSLNNGNTKWGNYYACLKEKNDLCYNVDSITIDIEDINKMKFECFSNDILQKLYLKCKREGILENDSSVTIINNSTLNEEIIYNIFKTDWLIDERLLEANDADLDRRKNYFQAIVLASEDMQDIKVQFRNKLFSYFIDTLNIYRANKKCVYTKVLKFENSFIREQE